MRVKLLKGGGGVGIDMELEGGEGGGGSVYRKDSCITGAERGVFDDAEGLKHVPPAAASGFWRWQLLRVSMAVRGGEDGDGNKRVMRAVLRNLICSCCSIVMQLTSRS